MCPTVSSAEKARRSWVTRRKGLVTTFWAKVDRSAPGACWPYTGGRDREGYGHLERNKRQVRAHRYAWELAYGPIPAGMNVLHHCDNPPCVKTEGDSRWPQGHLFLGTHADNVADMTAKGRGPTGEKHRSRTRPDTIKRGADAPTAKLTEDQVRDIRHRYALGGIRQRDLGTEFGLTQTGIGHIIRRKAWAHVP